MKHGSLFSGIGGFDLAAHWMGWENVFQCEKDEWCRKVLAKNFPNTNRYEDIKDFNAKKYYGTIDVISGGFPCQPFSVAGKRKGETDDRYLWAEMLRIIGEVKPTFVVGENVAGLLSMDNGRTLDKICIDLENEGYEVELFVIPACGIGGWHKRDRVWIVANTFNGTDSRKAGGLQGKNGQSRLQERQQLEQPIIPSEVRRGQVFPNSQGSRWNSKAQQELDEETYGRKQGCGFDNLREKYTGGNYWKFEPGVGRVATRIPNRVDRLKGLGNAIVPQVVYEIFKAIAEINNKKLN